MKGGRPQGKYLDLVFGKRRSFIKQIILFKYCSLRLRMKLVNRDQFSLGAFFFIFSQMLAAFFDANFACIPHVIRFLSAAALVRIGLDHLSLKKRKEKQKKTSEKQSINCRSARGGGGGVSY